MTVLVIGSSGGGTATLGHTDPVELLTAIERELGRIVTPSQNEEGNHGVLGINPFRAFGGMGHISLIGKSTVCLYQTIRLCNHDKYWRGWICWDDCGSTFQHEWSGAAAFLFYKPGSSHSEGHPAIWTAVAKSL